MLLMWHHFNSSIHNLRGDLKELSGKIDAVRDRVSRIEGLLIFAKIMPFEEIKSNEVTDQKVVLKDTKGGTVSYAQKLQQEGRLEGIQQIAKRMLHDNEPIGKIIRWTGISKESVKKLAF
jgi:hypothetical protein